MSKNEIEHVKALQRKRIRLAEERKIRENREQYGSGIIFKINSLLGQRLTIEEFSLNRPDLKYFEWPQNISEYNGLAAYDISESSASQLLTCCSNILGPIDGFIGFDSYQFMGFAALYNIDIILLLKLAKCINDTVIYYSSVNNCTLLVDYYKSAGADRALDFNIVVQGEEYEKKLEKCF